MKPISKVAFGIFWLGGGVLVPEIAQGQAQVLDQAQVYAQAAAPTTRAVFEQYRHDFGTFDEQGGRVSHTFRFTNQGKAPLVITSVGVSCGCTSPQFSKEPVMPGAGGEIVVTYDPEKRPGPFERAVTVFSNDARGPVQLVIAGNVRPGPRSLPDDYPFYVDAGLRIRDKVLSVGSVPRGRISSYTLGMANGGSRAVEVAVDGAQLPPYVSVKMPKARLEPGERAELEIAIDATGRKSGGGSLWGKRTWSFRLVVEGDIQPDPIQVQGTLVEDFSTLTPSELAAAPQAQYSAYFYHFSEQKAGPELTYRFALTNTGDSDLIVRYLGLTSDRIRASVDRVTIPPEQAATLTVTLLTKDHHGRLSQGVTVITNDPVRPTRDLWLMAELVR